MEIAFKVITIVHTRTHEHTRTHKEIHKHTHTHTRAYADIHTFTQLYAYTDVHIRTRTHTYAHTDTHKHIYKYIINLYTYKFVKGLISAYSLKADVVSLKGTNIPVKNVKRSMKEYELCK